MDNLQKQSIKEIFQDIRNILQEQTAPGYDCSQWDLFEEGMLDSFTDWRCFVAHEDELSMEIIEFRIGKCYISPDGILADLYKMRTNTVAYHTPGCGKYGNPAVIGYMDKIIFLFLLKLGQSGLLNYNSQPAPTTAGAEDGNVTDVSWEVNTDAGFSTDPGDVASNPTEQGTSGEDSPGTQPDQGASKKKQALDVAPLAMSDAESSK